MLRFYFWLLIFWILFLIISIILRKKKFGKLLLGISYAVFIFMLIEATCVFGLKIRTGYWLFKEKYNPNAEIFEPHPYLGSIPAKNKSLIIQGKKYSNNSFGFRGAEFEKNKTKYRIIAIGGSTTYGTNVNNEETWLYYLDSLLSDTLEILNFGVAGHSSAEHIIMASLIIPEYKPDLVIIHAGLNDLRNSHIDNLASDYSDYHAYNLQSVLGFCPTNDMPKLAIFRVAVLLFQKLGLYPLCPNQKIHISGKISSEPDLRLLQLYQRNLETLIAILHQQNVKVVFIPQLLIKEKVIGDELKWWIPFIPDSALVENMNVFNQTMKEVADRQHLLFIGQVLKYGWNGKDFADASHLNAEGNKKFAKIISKALFEFPEDTIR